MSRWPADEDGSQQTRFCLAQHIVYCTFPSLYPKSVHSLISWVKGFTKTKLQEGTTRHCFQGILSLPPSLQLGQWIEQQYFKLPHCCSYEPPMPGVFFQSIGTEEVLFSVPSKQLSCYNSGAHTEDFASLLYLTQARLI